MSTKRPKVVTRAALATPESKNIIHGEHNLYKLKNDCSLKSNPKCTYIKRNKMLHPFETLKVDDIISSCVS